MLDFAALPPEINSARMYAGPRSGSMMAAASAWNALAGELGSTALSFDSVISELADEEWMGPASASMASAAAPYVAWMSSTAAQAQQAATRARAAAAAFEAAFAMTVPPPVIAANRAQQAALVSTNVLGQNTPAIAANEAHYGEMWAQDAAAMYGYAGNSATASRLTPFTSPTQTINPAGGAGQAAAVTQAAGTSAGNSAQMGQLISTMPGALQSLSSPLALAPSGVSGLNGILGALGFGGSSATSGISGFLNGTYTSAVTAAAFIPPTLIPNLIGFLAGPGFNALGGGAAGSGLGALLAPGGALGNLGALGGGVSGMAAGLSASTSAVPAVSAGMGQASLVGALSTPSSWAAATPADAGSVASQGTGWTAPAESNTLAAMPGGAPAAGMGNRGGFGFGAPPRYGFKPTVMPRPVVV